ncbi:unnamed protein product [Vitrella brassicaformis CCMP3155]|uniref:Trm112p-like protein n=2 Tax=Vitrella brassicaformis TaxID=1169539 RepID=A0A0G4GWP5_VITBC|nr:unnamed protein product [Vitrella brassicaformis CCMP3155]|mmetsp:Transcript_45892/g.114115  ORF Transcript_45892/g.114115 Transcript_45892/m.114115 type:complete len:130 (+) Transcript_45892:182-571(+)|eukprot:CEM35199.1 unnamed protein product [Vitrella brassicaformis CCMP3155]
MRLLTHNLLMCNRKQCTGGFPLRIVLDTDIDKDAQSVEESEFRPEFIQHLLPKLDWEALYKTAQELNLSPGVPPSYSEEDKKDENFLRAVHDVVMDVHILEGKLVCPNCNREYPVSKGIPNMLLTNDEV